MEKKKLTINFLYIENSFIYKIKDLLKDKDAKSVIDFNNILDKSIDKTVSIKDKKLLIASLIIKKIKKILIKNNKMNLHLFYVLNSLDKDKVLNLNNLVSNYFKGDIINNLFTDSKKEIDKDLYNSIYRPETIKNNSFL